MSSRALLRMSPRVRRNEEAVEFAVATLTNWLLEERHTRAGRAESCCEAPVVDALNALHLTGAISSPIDLSSRFRSTNARAQSSCGPVSVMSSAMDGILTEG